MSFLGVIVMGVDGSYFGAKEDWTVTLMVLVHYCCDARIFPDGWDPYHVLEYDADANAESFVGATCLTLNGTRGAKGSLL